MRITFCLWSSVDEFKLHCNGSQIFKLPSKVVRGGAAAAEAAAHASVVVAELKTSACVYGLMFFDTLASRRLSFDVVT